MFKSSKGAAANHMATSQSPMPEDLFPLNWVITSSNGP